MVTETPPALPTDQVKDSISYVVDTAALEQLLSEQTSEGIIYIGIGSISILLAVIFLLIIKYSFSKGMAIPLLLLGIVELAEGFGSLSHNLDQSLQKVLAQNMQSLFLNRIFLYTSMAAFIVGILLYVRFYNSSRTFWKGLGLALFIQSFLLSGIFSLKENRLNRYSESFIETKHRNRT